jgi:hypothetical protein
MRELAGGLGGLREADIPAEMRNAVLDAFRDRPKG